MSAPLTDVDPDIAELLDKELGRPRDTLEMIASENFAPRSVLQLQGSVLTNKYAEGLPGRRYYGGLGAAPRPQETPPAPPHAVFCAPRAPMQPPSPGPGHPPPA